MNSPVDPSRVVAQACDAICRGHVTTVSVVAPFRQCRDQLVKGISVRLPHWKLESHGERKIFRDGEKWIEVTRCQTSEARLVLHDESIPSWASFARRFLDLARTDGRHPVFLASQVKMEATPWSFEDFAEWFNVIAHKTTWQKLDDHAVRELGLMARRNTKPSP